MKHKNNRTVMFGVIFSSSGSHSSWDERKIAGILAINVDEKKQTKKRLKTKQREFPKACRRTCEELQVGERLRQHPPTLFLHRQGDDHEPICKLRKVFNVVVVPEE